MALILHLLAETGRTVTELLADLPRYKMIKEKLECPSDKVGEILKAVRDEYAGRRMDLRDGVKIIFEDAWLHVRGSNTEPIIRLVVEARDDARARQILVDVFERVARVLR
jgi:phosphomannomutase